MKTTTALIIGLLCVNCTKEEPPSCDNVVNALVHDTMAEGYEMVGAEQYAVPPLKYPAQFALFASEGGSKLRAFYLLPEVLGALADQLISEGYMAIGECKTPQGNYQIYKSQVNRNVKAGSPT